MPEVVAYIRSSTIFDDSRATKEIIALCEAGHRVIAMGWDRSGQAEEKCLQVFSKYQVEFRFFKVRVEGSLGMRNIGKLLAWLRWVNGCLRREPTVTAVHACDLDAAVSVTGIARRRKLKFVYDIYDYYVDSHSIPRQLAGLVERLEIKVINGADLTVICTEERKKQIQKASPKRLLVIHNSPDVPARPDPKDCRYDYAYCGSLYEDRLLVEIFGGYPQNSDLKVAVAGYGNCESMAQGLAGQYPNFTFFGALPYDRVLDIENNTKVISAIYDPANKNNRLAAPNKFYEALALGKPVIVCAGTGIAKIVEQYKVGRVIDYDGEQFYRALRELLASEALRAEMGARARKLYDEKYRWDIMRRRLQEAYEKM